MEEETFNAVMDEVLETLEEYELAVHEAVSLLEILKHSILRASDSPPPTLRSVQ